MANQRDTSTVRVLMQPNRWRYQVGFKSRTDEDLYHCENETLQVGRTCRRSFQDQTPLAIAEQRVTPELNKKNSLFSFRLICDGSRFPKETGVDQTRRHCSAETILDTGPGEPG